MVKLITYSKHLKYPARMLRKNMTEAEDILWSHIRRKQLCCTQFLRQKPISCYIVDFYAKAPRLAIELDGEIHNTSIALEYDKNREKMLNNLGIQVIRFANHEVIKEIHLVLKQITDVLNKIYSNNRNL